jgi:hypothetical protein
LKNIVGSGKMGSKPDKIDPESKAAHLKNRLLLEKKESFLPDTI